MTRRRVIAALALVSVFSLGACSSAEVVVQAQAPQSGEVTPNLDEGRINDVLYSVQHIVETADSDFNAKLFEGRVTDGAARARAAQYAYAVASGDTLPVLDLTPQNITVTNSEAWPRLILNIRQADSSQLPLVEVFVQKDARSRYSLTHWCRMLGGTSVTMPAVEQGTNLVSGDTTGFITTPKRALESYVEMLNAGQNSTDAFAGDEFTALYHDTVKTLASSLQSAGTVTANAQVTDDPIYGIVLEDGSALVAANFTYTLNYSRTIARSTMRLGGQTATMNPGDDDTVKGSATATYLATVLINIPSASQGGVSRIVGAERILSSVQMDDSTNPDN